MNNVLKRDGYVVVISGDIKKMSQFCSQCEYVMTTTTDEMYTEKYGCCEYCFNKFVKGREAQWESGNRPSNEALKQVIQERAKMTVNIDI